MRSVTALLCCALLAAEARAIVNTQPLLEKLGGDGISGELRTSFEWQTGNVDLLRLSAGALFLFRRCDNTVVWSSALDIGETNDESFLYRMFSHLRYQYRASELVTWEAFGQIAHDRFRRITLRGLLGTGPRWTLVEGESAHLAWGTAYMFEHEEYGTGEDLSDSGQSRDNHRLSTYLNARVAANERVDFSATIFYQPRFDAWADDWRLLSEIELSIQLVEQLALTVSFTVAYDSTPPDDIEKLDTATKAGVKFSF